MKTEEASHCVAKRGKAQIKIQENQDAWIQQQIDAGATRFNGTDLTDESVRKLGELGYLRINQEWDYGGGSCWIHETIHCEERPSRPIIRNNATVGTPNEVLLFIFIGVIGFAVIALAAIQGPGR
jgi:hypothetical protein